MSNLSQPVRMKHIPSIAFSAIRWRPTPDRLPKPPGKNWAKALENRHPELKTRRVRALDWNRHENNTYKKITHWFEVIGAVLQDLAILAENAYNMDETGVMLSMSGSVKVLVVTQPRGFWKRHPSGKSTGYIFMLTPGPLYEIEIIIKIYILVSNLPFTQTFL